MLQLLDLHQPHPMHDTAATRRMEQAAAAQLPAHTLMRRAGLSVARLAVALAPHARTVWIACGPGNNGGDGLEAAMHLRRWGLNPVVTLLGNPQHIPADARASFARAQEAGVAFAETPPPLHSDDLCIDALLGIGGARAPEGRMAEWLSFMAASSAHRLAVDVPSGLNADTGVHLAKTSTSPSERHHTLSLLTLKPGLFTMQGRDACGTLWFDDLGIAPEEPPIALLNVAAPAHTRPHASHKGTWGDVAVIGGHVDSARGIAMGGAALLAGRAALSNGAGRVYVSLLGDASLMLDVATPELMFRRYDALDLRTLSVVCGCGGGEAVADVLEPVLDATPRLVLDADALNAIAGDPVLQTAMKSRAERGQATVLTPHPLEAARLLSCNAADVQNNRLNAAQEIARRFQCTVVLKGSGTAMAAPGQLSRINPTGNARLATAGTGDVLAGMIGARLASGCEAFEAACTAVWQHGHMADIWPKDLPFTAGSLC
ncbi:NAD(P)H-hydrate dehydratase [Ottowia caeni]|uniref:NAD(P)H-hydrate dehydratase n=1 Tax=Ottowia caeni TaxID=2870339 RepID=UPI001E2E0CA8|nr:NAD(P)H-hydrate dehydratase [Ottowia caeni]